MSDEQIARLEAERDQLQSIILASSSSNYAAAEIQLAGMHNNLRRAEAELARLRTVYAAAAEECKAARKAYENGFGMGKCHILVGPSMRHDTARAEAGMENL